MRPGAFLCPVRKTAILLAGAGAGFVGAEPPSLKGLYPAGGAAGTTVVVTAEGSLDPWPLAVWTATPGLRFTPVVEEEKKGRWQVEIAPDCAPGPHLIRASNAEGADQPRMFVVSRAAEVAEVEPNNHVGEAQEVQLGRDDHKQTTLNGQWNPRGDVDAFALCLARGESVEVRCRAYALDSPVDPILSVRDQRGVRLAFNHDAPGRTLDPALVFKAPDEGTYIFETAAFAHPPAADHKFTGDFACVYRLTFRRPSPPESPSEPQTLPDSVPFEVRGSIGEPGEVDRVAWEAAKGESFHIEVTAEAEGSLLDAVLELRDATGKALETADDEGDRFDPSFDWEAPESGRYEARVSSRFRSQAGPQFHYRLRVRRNQPDFAATVPAHAWTVKAGEAAEVTVAVARLHGHDIPLKLEVEGLPPGLTAETIDIPKESKEIAVPIRAAPEAEPGGFPFGLTILESGGEQRRRPVVRSMKWAYCESSHALVKETGDFWITVAAE